jgi:hypothetical protein
MLLMQHCKKSSASTILTGKQERDNFRRDITPVAHTRRATNLLPHCRST